jgi:hypothetical protein
MSVTIDHRPHGLIEMRTAIQAAISLQERAADTEEDTDHLVETVLGIAEQAARQASVDLSHVIQKLEIWDLIAESEDENGRVEHALVRSVRRDLEKLRGAEGCDRSSRQRAGGASSEARSFDG